MNTVTPEIYLIGESKINPTELKRFLTNLGAPEWESTSKSDVEILPEFYGRLCYKSFKPGLNPNVTKVRDNGKEYLSNILKIGHESVLEHSQLNFVFDNVSRVFTHELVRHRAGVAISQESLRFVRLDNLKTWVPSVILENAEATELFFAAYRTLENAQKQLAEIFDIVNISDFAVKKELTSAFRRIAPIGLATTIGWTTNIRALRWVIEQRTSRHAEEEIRQVFDKVARMVYRKYPSLFQDMAATRVRGILEWKPNKN